MKIDSTFIEGLFVGQSTLLSDSRGSFSRLFCVDELYMALGDRKIVQINHSKTNVVGAVRGMHYQVPPYAEMKIVRCIKGRVLDVAVDLRKGSATLFKWYSEELSAENNKILIIPEGFAHGFQVLESDSELLYLHTHFYKPSHEGGVNPLDSKLNIKWPIPLTQLSEKDEKRSLINDEFKGINT